MRGGKKSGKMFEVNDLPGVQSIYHKNGAFGLYLEWFLLSWHVYFTAGGVFLQMRYTTWSISWSASINVRIQPCIYNDGGSNVLLPPYPISCSIMNN